jgi:hypothetical protein
MNQMLSIMKKIFTLATITIIGILMLEACTKQNYIDTDERYWLSQERGEVVYSGATCDFYVISTNNGYTVIHSKDGYRPFEGTILYGNFSNYGARDFYDPSNAILESGDVVDYWLSYNAAQNEVNDYCY